MTSRTESGCEPARVYVAAPYADASMVRVIHEQLRARGLTPTSSWAESAAGAENLEAMTLAQRRAAADQNDDDLACSDVVLVLAREGAGGEMFCELRLAVLLSIPVVYVGARRVLSAYRSGVTIAEDLDAAISAVTAVRDLALVG